MQNQDNSLSDIEALEQEAELYNNPLTEKQRDILRAAEMLFSESGFAQTSTASIAKEAGVTEKTLFKHFPSKHDLLRRVLFPLLLKTIIPIQLRNVKKILQSPKGSARELFRSLALDRWATAKTLGPRLRFVLAEFMQNEKVRELHLNVFGQHVWPQLIKTVQDFQNKGEIRRDISADKIAQLLFMSIAGQAMLRGVVLPNAVFDDQVDVDVLLTMLMEGIGRSDSHSPE